jgi:hypothetical protein
MTPTPLFDPARQPARADLDARLGAAAPLWHKAIAESARQLPQVAEAWHFAGAKIGWSLRLMDGARIVVYLTPEDGAFRVGFVLGGKAVAAAREAGLSAEAAAVLDLAPKHAEGYGVQFHVAAKHELEPFGELLAIKLATAPTLR